MSDSPQTLPTNVGKAGAPMWVATIYRFSDVTGRTVAWLLLAMVLIEALVVLLRYGFNSGSIALQESVGYLHALAFMLGAAYTLLHDEHVRVDIFYRRFSPQRQALVNLLGFLLLLLPVCGFIIWSSMGYVGQSWAIREASVDADGLAGVFLLKTLIPLFAVLLIVQGFASAVDDWLVLRGRESSSDKQGVDHG